MIPGLCPTGSYNALRALSGEGRAIKVFRIMDVVETLDIGCITERLEKNATRFKKGVQPIGCTPFLSSSGKLNRFSSGHLACTELAVEHQQPMW